MQIGMLIKAKNALMSHFHEKMSPKLSYKLVKFLSIVETEERFFNEKMKEIIECYCEKDENGNFIPVDNGLKIKDGATEECNKAICELEAVEIEVPQFKFTLNELDELKFSMQDMLVLSAFIDEE